MSPKKWINATNAIGIVSKAGRYGGTYAHSDIAMSFATWISPEFQLYIMKDYRRLKTDENSRLSLNWNLNREISKLNYKVHTDAIKGNLIPPKLSPAQVTYTYASETSRKRICARLQRDIAQIDVDVCCGCPFYCDYAVPFNCKGYAVLRLGRCGNTEQLHPGRLNLPRLTVQL